MMYLQADVYVWNLSEAKRRLDAGQVMIGDACKIHRLKQHLGEVKDLAFSSRNDYLCTLGGQDDNAIVVWHVESGEAVCGSPAASDSVQCVKWLHGRNDRLVTAGFYHVRVWQIDFRQPKLHVIEAKLGSLRRVYSCLDITPDDSIAYCGTTTGDIVKVKIDRDEIRSYNEPDIIVPILVAVSKDRVARGVKCVSCVLNDVTGNTNVLVGAGDGTLAYINPQLNYVKSKQTQLMGGVTSISQHCISGVFNVGTDQCNRYEVNAELTNATMKSSCHYGSVNDVSFPNGCPDLIVSSSAGDIRVWNIRMKQELLRIQVPNLECLCTSVSPSGSSLVSGWDDGKIRSFFPETGRLKFVIPDAHSEKVTALAIVDNDARGPWRLISGGSEGRVRIWNVTPTHQAMLSSLKEHRGPVNSLKITKDAKNFISASSDGSCIVWDIERCCRIMAFFEPTVFSSVLYHPDESQMLTCGSNHKIAYWDATDGQAIRVLEGGEGSVTSLDIAPSGEFFISGCADHLLKVWHYDEGLTVAVGKGHSGSIKAVKLSPDQKTIVSVGSTGEIIFWEMPPAEQLRRGLLVE